MPTYEYECGECSRRFEHFHPNSEERNSAPPCPSCGSRSGKRLMSAFTVGRGQPRSGGHTCCGSSGPEDAGCSGPGSCCSDK